MPWYCAVNDLQKLRAIFAGLRLPVSSENAKKITVRIEAEIGKNRHYWSSANNMRGFNLVFYVDRQSYLVRNEDIKW